MAERTAGKVGPDLIGRRRGRYYAWLAAVALGVAVGLYGIVRVLTEGTVVLGIDSQLPWGILISTYAFFVLISTGVCIGLTSLVSVFGIRRYEPLVKRGVFVSIATLAAGGVVIMAGVGQPLRTVPRMLLSPNPSAPMWWMIVLYGVYGTALAAEFFLLERDGAGSRWIETAVGLIALVAPLLAGAMLGGIFGTAGARPYYGGVFASVYLLVTAVLSGVAAVSALWIAERKLGSADRPAPDAELVGALGRYLAVLVAIGLLLAGLRHGYGLSATADTVALAHREMLLGAHGGWYVGFGIVLGSLVPLAVLAHPRGRTETGVLVASVAVLIGMFASRLEFVLGGQIVALVEDPSYEFPIVSYAPSGAEIAIVVLGFAVFAALYTVGRELFDLDELPEGERTTAAGGDGPTGKPSSETEPELPPRTEPETEDDDD